ncbi:hypothetical protein Mucpa_0175 [Mucilaginibacter paludis DSM 18603]|uniref:Uncharacterized protein n=1 Tax=Mucilaginibacter paludis DSM 18603 TaxID=714943 RepID=H1YEV8_9SPHI|nr:hypothetical protein Mucpa_0175 [Mucilaginibacter paludis DSM 18603]
MTTNNRPLSNWLSYDGFNLKKNTGNKAYAE